MRKTATILALAIGSLALSLGMPTARAADEAPAVAYGDIARLNVIEGNALRLCRERVLSPELPLPAEAKDQMVRCVALTIRDNI
jgi:hypothetical protein